ncbi:MAG: hypothetical protein AAGJ87_14710, partial [Pseudomonadota bacterium]
LSMILGPPLMTQIFAAFTTPDQPIVIFGTTVSSTGAPFYFPGASFFLAGVLAAFSLIPLSMAIGRIQRPRKEAASTT